MSKKEKVVESLEIDGKKIKEKEGGIYSLFPYEKLNKGKGLFKVGLADSFSHRIESYHTYYPAGLYITNLLVEPNSKKQKSIPDVRINRNMSEAEKEKILKQRVQNAKNSRIARFREVEDFVFDKLEHSKGSKRYLPTTRTKNVKANQEKHGGNKEVGGDSEWFYTSKKILDDTFHAAQDKFGGRNEENHSNDFDKNAAANKKKATYTAEIHYKIH